MRNQTLLARGIMIVAAMGIAGPGHAQEELTEIVVTAQKRAQNLQEVPVAVNAFTGAQLSEAGVVQPLDLAEMTPNLTAKNGVGNTAPIFALRGISLNDFATNGTQPVGVYLDEVYLANNSQLSFQTMDMERVEVLKGPQGTLYGRNTTAGAVSFITNKPTNQFDSRLSLTAGEWDLFSAEGYVNGPLTENLSGRFSLSAERQLKGFFEDDATGRNWGQSRRASWRGQLLWNLGDTHILANLHGGIDKSDNWYYKWIGEAVPGQTTVSTQDAALAAVANPNIYHGNHAFSPSIDNLSNGLTLSADHDYGLATLKAITGIEDLEYARTEDYGSIPVPNGWNDYAGHLLQYSEELRLTSNGDHAWNWIVGAFVGHDRLRENDLYNELQNPLYYTYVFGENYVQTTTSAALFTHNEVRLTDALRLTLGLRYSDEQKRYRGGTTALGGDHSSNVFFPNDTVCVPNCLVDSVLKYREPTGNIGLDYRFDNVMLYSSASRGYKSGGVTGFYVTDSGAKQPYKPEFINAYEVGFKSSWAGNTLRLNGALFYYDYKDLQAFGVIGNEFRIFNIAKSRVDGVELESSWLPFTGFKWDLGLGLLHTKVLESDIQTIDPSGNFVGIVGNRLGNAPNLELDSGMSYHWPVSDKLMASVVVDANWRGGTFYYVQGDPRQFQPAYVLVDPRLTLSDAADVWKISLWAKNVTNKKYYREIFNDGASVIGFPAAPRQIGASFSYHWQ
ncbi:MAG: TonB-dependent receptor [Gammaproteobacteria bacterium]|nr:TonB-dependent receptor [Gammaproteobacteria bacterium]